jgi:hypothetical protein
LAIYRLMCHCCVYKESTGKWRCLQSRHGHKPADCCFRMTGCCL